jgi:CRISPR-associated protein Csd1
MSWIQKLYETYEQCAGAAQFANNPLQPISHTTQQAHIEIVIDGQGIFLRANVLTKADQTTLIPCTQVSGGRSGSKPLNHPLCDKLQYIAADYREFGGEVTSGFAKDPDEPHRNYLESLTMWATSLNGHPKLDAVLKYVQRNRIIHDLVDEQILFLDAKGKLLKAWGGDKKDAPPIFKIMPNGQSPEDAFVRWRVQISGESCSGTWEDLELIDAWIHYYASQQQRKGLCLVKGEELVLAEQHPAKLRNSADKAKLISSNDSSGYTYRGRFTDADQACGVSFEVTQKAHKALQWLIARQGFRNGDQAIITWDVGGNEIPDPFKSSADLFGIDVGEAGAASQYQGDAGQSFARRLNNCIRGYRTRLGSTGDIVVMALDSATPGRMAITYYRELTGSGFLDRVEAWHEAGAWPQNYSKELKFVGMPSPKDIAEVAFGRRLDDKLRKATVERLLPCVIDGQRIPRDLMESAVRRVANRLGLEKREWEKNLGIACALFKGYNKERNYQMTLETNRTSRDYLYGRLLAAAENLEGRALYLAGEKRDTNAAKLMQRFADHPCSTWRTIELALPSYKTRLRSKRPGFLHEMETLIDEIVSTFQGKDFVNDARLTGEFLLGYHCQRQALRPPAQADIPDEPNETQEGE